MTFNIDKVASSTLRLLYYVYEPDYSDYEDIGNVNVDNCGWIRMLYINNHDNNITNDS